MAKFVIIKIIAFFDLIFKCIYYTSTDLFTSNTYEQTQGHLQVTAQVQFLECILIRDLKRTLYQFKNKSNKLLMSKYNYLLFCIFT